VVRVGTLKDMRCGIRELIERVWVIFNLPNVNVRDLLTPGTHHFQNRPLGNACRPELGPVKTGCPLKALRLNPATDIFAPLSALRICVAFSRLPARLLAVPRRQNSHMRVAREEGREMPDGREPNCPCQSE
jgi:hypothetical protein